MAVDDQDEQEQEEQPFKQQLIDALRKILTERYGRVIEGLSRQLRAKLHHDPLVGAYEITIAVSGRD